MGTQEHVKIPKRTAGTPEYITMGAGKINPLRIVQCGSYIHDIDVGKRESETEREREREREREKKREREREREKINNFHSEVRWSNVSC